MDVIITKRLKGYDVTVIYVEDSKTYMVQMSKKPYDEITDEVGEFSNKKFALKKFKEIITQLKAKRNTCKKCGRNSYELNRAGICPRCL